MYLAQRGVAADAGGEAGDTVRRHLVAIQLQRREPHAPAQQRSQRPHGALSAGWACLEVRG